MNTTVNTIKKIFIGITALTILLDLALLEALFYGGWDINTVLFLIPFCTLIAGTILFKKQSKYGIVLLTVYSAYASIILICTALSIVDLFSFTETAGYFLVPILSPLIQIIAGISYVVLLWFLSKKETRDEFEVPENRIVISIIIGLIFSFIGLVAV